MGSAARGLAAAAALILALAATAFAAEPPVPAPQGVVTDLAGVLDAGTRQRIVRAVTELEAKTGAEIAVLTVESTEPLDDFTYAMRVADTWKVGRRGDDTGVLIVVATRDRKLRILTGYGLEGILPDGLVGRIQDRDMVPAFRAGRIGEGIERGVTALAQRIVDGHAGIPPPSEEPGVAVPSWAVLLLLLLVLLFLAWVASQTGGGPGGGRHYRRRPGGWREGGPGGGLPAGFPPGAFGGGGGGFEGFGGGRFGGGGAGRSW